VIIFFTLLLHLKLLRFMNKILDKIVAHLILILNNFHITSQLMIAERFLFMNLFIVNNLIAFLICIVLLKYLIFIVSKGVDLSFLKHFASVTRRKDLIEIINNYIFLVFKNFFLILINYNSYTFLDIIQTIFNCLLFNLNNLTWLIFHQFFFNHFFFLIINHLLNHLIPII
jgi:hypothetical protein